MGLTDQQKLDAIKTAVDAAATPGTQPVSGPLTDAQLRATAVPVATGLSPLTDAQLRATAVPVSGPLTDAQLRAAAVPVSMAATPAGAALAANQYEHRPSDKSGRTYFSHLRTSAGTFRTVGSGKDYVVWLTVSATNTSTTTDLVVSITDNAGNVWQMVVPRGVAAGAIGAAHLHVAFPEPLQFSTNVAIATSGGTLGTLAATIGGYEE